MFSERYGYANPREIIIREQITEPIENSICNWIACIKKKNSGNARFDYNNVKKHVWVYFLNRRIDAYSYYIEHVIEDYIVDAENVWWKKLDLIEVVCSKLSSFPQIDTCAYFLNSEFERHNFAYRLIDGHIVEITTEEEIDAIEKALETPMDGVKIHLHTALKHISPSQGEPDYRNSIKESISAVECLCRNVTNKDTLGKALKELEAKGIVLNDTLKVAFDKLYGYTNNPDTGVRHALMEDTNAPTSAEAIYMLITCSAFINYLNTKLQ